MGHLLLDFGQHRLQTYNDVRRHSPSYTAWVLRTMVEETEASEKLKCFERYLAAWAILSASPTVDEEDPDPNDLPIMSEDSSEDEEEEQDPSRAAPQFFNMDTASETASFRHINPETMSETASMSSTHPLDLPPNLQFFKSLPPHMVRDMMNHLADWNSRRREQ